MPRVNPDILRWARETAGFDIDEAARKLGLREARGVGPRDRLRALETGEAEPTRPLLLKMAKQYRRPLLAFYLPEPPRKGDRGRDFRTLPEDYSDVDEARLDALIRDVRARQGLVRAALDDEEEATPLPFIGSMSRSAGVMPLVDSIRETLRLHLDQFRAAPNPSAAFKLLRSHAEEAGVFVLVIGDLGSYHTVISLETFRGFALADPIAPFVIINDQDSRAAWSFTLIHELAHLWLGQTGVSGRLVERNGEQLCNDVASEFLLPANELPRIRFQGTLKAADLESLIDGFAAERNVSRSMVAYKLYRQQIIDYSLWQSLSSRFQQQWVKERIRKKERNKEHEGGPSYYVLQRHRVGQALIEFATRMMAAGELTTVKAGRVLGVKPKQVHDLVKPKQVQDFIGEAGR